MWLDERAGTARSIPSERLTSRSSSRVGTSAGSRRRRLRPDAVARGRAAVRDLALPVGEGGHS